MSEKKKTKPIKLIDDPSELPTDLSDEEQLEFWETHGLSEEFLDKTEEVPDDERPRRREKATPISVRFDAHTLDRIKLMADRRGIGYQTLLKQFVGERLYEEEKREGLVSASDASTHEEASREIMQQMTQQMMDTYMQLLNTPGSYLSRQAEQQQQTLQQTAQQWMEQTQQLRQTFQQQAQQQQQAFQEMAQEVLSTYTQLLSKGSGDDGETE